MIITVFKCVCTNRQMLFDEEQQKREKEKK